MNKVVAFKVTGLLIQLLHILELVSIVRHAHQTVYLAKILQDTAHNVTLVILSNKIYVLN